MSSDCDSDSSEWEVIPKYEMESDSESEEQQNEQVVEKKEIRNKLENALYCLEHQENTSELVCVHPACSLHTICSSCDLYGGSKEEGFFKNEYHKFVPIAEYIEATKVELDDYLENLLKKKRTPIWNKLHALISNHVRDEWVDEERHLLSEDYRKLMKIESLIEETSRTENIGKLLETFEELRKLRIEEKRIKIPRPFRDWEKEIEADCEHVIFCGMSSILAFFPLAFILLLFGGEAMEYQKGISILYKGFFTKNRQKRFSFRTFDDFTNTPSSELEKCKVFFFLMSKDVDEFLERIENSTKFAKTTVVLFPFWDNSDDMKKINAKCTVGDDCS